MPILLIFYINPYTFSEETEIDEEALKLLENVLQIELEVKLIQPGEINAWNSKTIKYTIPGYTVILKVEGTNIKFHGYFTPYLNKNDLFLIAQGHVWLSDPIKKSLRYFTCVKSISLKFGEKVVFLPLGITKSSSEHEVHNIEIEILILPYSHKPGEDKDEKEEILD